MEILGVDQVDTSTQEYFEQRTAAARRVYDQMDESQKKNIDDEVKKRKAEANEPEIQQKWVQLTWCQRLQCWDSADADLLLPGAGAFVE